MTIAPAVSCVTSPVQEYEDGASTPSVEYIRGSDYGGGIGGILYTLRGSTPSFKHYNSRGDVVAATNASGSLTYQAAYEAFGQHGTTDSSAEWTDGATPVDRQQGNTKDEDPTGLLNEGFRYRDLETGTFITPDPLGFVDGPNVYTYVVQNPWTNFDPQGLTTYGTNFYNGGGINNINNQLARPEHAGTLLTGIDVGVTTAGITLTAGFGAAFKEAGREFLNRAFGIPTDLADLAKMGKGGARNLAKNADEVNAPKADSVDTHSGATNSGAKSKAEADANAQQTENVGQQNQQSGQASEVESKASDQVVGNEAHSATNALNLEKQLSSEEQLSQLADGGGTVISQPAKQADRIASQTGRNAEDIQKVSSEARVARDGQQIQTHTFRDASDNGLIQPKTIIDESN